MKQSEMGCQLILIANRKLNMGFWLVRTSMTVNGVIAFILHYFTKFSSFGGRLRQNGWN